MRRTFLQMKQENSDCDLVVAVMALGGAELEQQIRHHRSANLPALDRARNHLARQIVAKNLRQVQVDGSQLSQQVDRFVAQTEVALRSSCQQRFDPLGAQEPFPKQTLANGPMLRPPPTARAPPG